MKRFLFLLLFSIFCSFNATGQFIELDEVVVCGNCDDFFEEEEDPFNDPCLDGTGDDCECYGIGCHEDPDPDPCEENPDDCYGDDGGGSGNSDDDDEEEEEEDCKNKDLRNKTISDAVKNQIDQRTQGVSVPHGSVAANTKSFEIQTIKNGIGDINLDRYSLDINRLPDGYTPQQLFEEIRTNFYGLVTGGDFFWEKAEFMSYAAQDTNSWSSTNPVGSAMDFDTLMDTATVMCTEYSYSDMYWVFTTVHSVDHLGHPVSGHRWFGIEENSTGGYSFVVRGADRLSTWVDSAANVVLGLGGDFAFDLADRTWKNLMETIEKFINDKPGGDAKSFDKNKEYAKRYEYNEEDCQ